MSSMPCRASFRRLAACCVPALRGHRARRRPASDGSRSRTRRSSRPPRCCLPAAPRSPARSSRASTCASRRRARCSAFHAGDPIPRAATVFFRQDRKSYRSVVNLTAGTYTPPVLIPRSDGQLGLTITEVSDFSFAFADPAFLQALARRGITTADQSSNVLVTPLTPGSFGLPEEARRIVKAQMYFRENAAINLYARPIEGLQAIMDLDDRVVLQVIDTGVVPVPPLTHEFDEATVSARYGLRPAMKPITVAQPAGANFTLTGNFVEWQKWQFHLRFERRPGTVISLATLRRTTGPVPGLARRDLRAVPGSGHPLVLQDVHGRRRVRLRPAVIAARAGARRAVQRDAARRPGGGRPARPERPGRAAAAAAGGRRVRAPHRQSRVASFRAVRRTRARVRRTRRGRARRAVDLAARQLRLHGRLGLQPERRRFAWTSR